MRVASWDQLPIVQGGAVAILAWVFIQVMRGRIVPRRTLDDMKAERDTWRDAHRVSEEARHIAQGQVGQLLELSRTASHVLTALPQPSGQEVTASAPVDRTPTASAP